MPAPVQFSEEELRSIIWSGRTSGRLYRVTSIDLVDGETMATYARPDGKTYRKPIAYVSSNLQPAEIDSIWKKLAIAETAEKEGGEEGGGLWTLVTPEEKHTFDWLILHDETRSEIKVGLNSIVRGDLITSKWRTAKVYGACRRNVLNFFGPPGTGKTHSAICVATHIGKKLMLVDYAGMISKYVGDTAKHIRKVFEDAAKNDAVLFFDEADSLMSRRISMAGGDDGSATSINQNRNVMMQCVDQFKGVVILSTNFFGNYDPAFLRRITRSVEFQLPSAEMRRRIFKAHLPETDLIQLSDADLDLIASISAEFSGGDILVACGNAISRASMPENPDDWRLTVHDLEAEIGSIKAAKRANRGSNTP